jgi:hypothetical protein
MKLHAPESKHWRSRDLAFGSWVFDVSLDLGVCRLALPWLLGFCCCFAHSVSAQTVLGEPQERVIHYEASGPLADPVARLQRRLADGSAKLNFDPARGGYLPSLLLALGVHASSQGLVFSKTSTQRERIDPGTPRAVYFGDDAYVGFVPGGPVMEMISVDPTRGPIFYTLEQSTNGPPVFSRRADCMQCHLGPRTLNVPGLVVRSVYTATNGIPLAPVEGFINGHNSPFEKRWGGWYVTGTHLHTQPDEPDSRERPSPLPIGWEGSRVRGLAGVHAPGSGDLHLGNLFSTDPSHPDQLDLSAGANVTDLRARFDTSRYLSPHSDLVALLVLEHQVRMQNLITRANYETLYALDERTRSPAAAGDGNWPEQRIARAGEMLLEYMLFRNEAPLHGPLKGTSAFTTEFQLVGPLASKGRSLRQLDLDTRLLRYPCSFQIYSPAFDALPPEMKNYLWRRLQEILTGQDRTPTYASLSARGRQDILEILQETKPEFKSWLLNYPIGPTVAARRTF